MRLGAKRRPRVVRNLAFLEHPDALGAEAADVGALAGRVEDADALVLYHNLGVYRKTIERLTRCKLIVRSGVGIDNVDHVFARERGIPVANVPDYGIADAALDPVSGAIVWQVRGGSLGPTTVTIEEVPSLHVAYVRHTGRYQGLGEVFADLFTRLMTWAQPRGLVHAESRLLALYHDNPSITESTQFPPSVSGSVSRGVERYHREPGK